MNSLLIKMIAVIFSVSSGEHVSENCRFINHMFRFSTPGNMFPSNLLRLSKQVNFAAARFFSTSLVRHQSSSSKDLVLVDVNDKTGFATVSMNSMPVNSLNLELLTAFSNSLDELKKDNVKGMILTSVRPNEC